LAPASSIGTFDQAQIGDGIELQPLHDAETVAQRSGQGAGAGGGADQGEGRQVEADGTRRRPLADHDVELVVLHRRVQHFLHHRRQAVDLVDEQDVARLQIGQQGRQVPRPLQHRAGGLAHVHPHLGGEDVRQGGLAQARRPEDQHMVQCLAAAPGGVDEYAHLLAHRRLADVLLQLARTQGALEALLFAGGGG
jgi:hypothetical protein